MFSRFATHAIAFRSEERAMGERLPECFELKSGGKCSQQSVSSELQLSLQRAREKVRHTCALS